MKVTITGGAGFIGSHIAESFHKQGASICVLDNLRSGYKHNIDELNVDFIEGSILDLDCVKKAVSDADYVFHLAAMISVPESAEKPEECNEINVTGLQNVLEESAKANVKKLVFSSSAAIYGDNPTVPKLETMTPEPKSPYASSKLDGEHLCNSFTQDGKINTACCRYFNVFGPRQDPGSQYAAAVPIFIHQALKNEPITIYGDGEQTRDFIFVKDIAAANVYLATETDASGVYNIAYGQRMTINDLAKKIINATGSTSEIVYAEERAGDVKHSMASIDKVLSTGFKPSGQLEEGLKKTIEFFASK